MAMPKTPPYWDEKTFGATHKYREYPQRAKGTSFFVFVFSIFFYISIFYVFNLSPSTFLNNNKFWFFISNTLILIIAADYGAFSSSKNKRDFYEEYVMHKQASSVASFVPQFPETAKKSTSTTTSPPEEEVLESFDQEKAKQISTSVPHQEIEDNQEKKGLEIVVWSEPENMIDDKRKKYTRSKSEKPRRVVIDESKNIVLRSDSMTETGQETESVEENEFSNMSDEELNRRVEEFIQKFNRQIRLQRAGNFC